MRAAHFFAATTVSFLSALAGASTGAVAQQQPAAGCQARPALGVSRTIEVDAARGPRFGHQQYKDLTVLNDREVVLTFDDGPLRPYTRPVLEALDAHCTRATFFMVGRMAAGDPEMVREVARRGHTIAHHTWSHSNMRTTNVAGQRQEIELGISMVQRTAGTPVSPFFRFPYLSDPAAAQSYLASRNIAMFSIEVDSNDYRTKDANAVHRTVMNQVMSQGKGIILFHDIQPSTAGALRRVLDDLAANKFKVVHFVSKSPVVTLPEFDAMADRELAKRRTVVAAQPLAPRAMTWPVGSPSPTTTKVAAPAASARPLAPPALTSGAQVPASAYSPPPSPVPMQSPAVQSPEPMPPPPPVERPTRFRGEEPSWQSRVFDNSR
jgi:peptidoglycan/xylan/chitin deacetylase (PgdA/CDA1 family)